MQRRVSLREVKQNLSRYVKAAEAGDANILFYTVDAEADTEASGDKGRLDAPFSTNSSSL